MSDESIGHTCTFDLRWAELKNEMYAKRSYEIMSNILMWLVVIVAGGMSLVLCLYMLLSMFVMIGYKIYRKIKYNISLYD